MKLGGNTVLITGGGSGIGFSLARAFLEAGDRVVICGRQQQRVDKAKSVLPDVMSYRCDITDGPAVDALLARLAGDGCSPDILVNNAATHTRFDFKAQDAPVDDITQEILANLVAPMVLTKKILPHLLTCEAAAIINIGSGLALVPKRTAPMYCASKAGLHAFSISLRGQLEGTNVKVMEVLPGQIETEMTKGRGPKQKLSADVLARQILDAFEQDRQELIPGDMASLALLARFSPAAAARRVRAMTE